MENRMEILVVFHPGINHKTLSMGQKAKHL